ncbi:DinB family protein [Amycolatopsis samaneae]|uniref:DinB family protein n=1 Tax=Amycolatopsis samaneae TaxID=664691 RepID=A0ABW5G6W7_9PSEU
MPVAIGETVPVTEDGRPEPPLLGDERAQLTGFLDHLRATVVLKASGLSEEQARRSLVPSELTTVAGLVRHLAYVEQYWFRVVLGGEPDTWAAILAEDRDADFRLDPDVPLAALVTAYEAECRNSREVAAGLGFSDEFPFRGGRLTVRWVITHLIEETARHAGHLDLLRELLDGSTGE